jgi:spore maturation protein CgeB
MHWRNELKKLPFVSSLNATIKAAAAEHEAAAIYRRYDNEARKRGIRTLRGFELKDALAHRIHHRATRLGWPKPKGSLHIFFCYGCWNWEAVLPRALAPFGEVTAFDWRSHDFLEERPRWLDQRDEMNALLLKTFFEANRRRPVDLVIGYISGFTVSPQALRQMAAAGAVIVNFCFDDKLRFPGSLIGGRYGTTAAIADVVDLNLTSDPNGFQKYAVHGGLAMFHPEAASPELHFPRNLPFEHDVSFIGARYGWRPRFIERLQALGIEIACYGAGWPKGAVTNEEMATIYSKSRINLGFGGIGHSRKLVNLKGRDFEVPMSGGLYLTQYNPELQLVYDIGREIVTYTNEVDCARIIHELLAAPERATSIRTSGYQRARKDHTYEARWTTALETLGALA